MKATELRSKLAALNLGVSDREVEISIGEAADGNRLVIANVVEDDNCGGEFPIVVIECKYAEGVEG
jgi:hypothetical protein